MIAGYNIRKSGECFGVGTGDTVKRNKATASETAEYENCGNEIRIGSAKALTVDNYVFTDLGRSLLRLDQEDRGVRLILHYKLRKMTVNEECPELLPAIA